MGSTRFRRSFTRIAYFSETVPYADLILPDTTYLERWDAISMLDRPISGAEGAADSIRQPVVQPDRDVRPFQEILLEIGVGLGLRMNEEDSGASSRADIPTISSTTSARRVSAP